MSVIVTTRPVLAVVFVLRFVPERVSGRVAQAHLQVDRGQAGIRIEI